MYIRMHNVGFGDCFELIAGKQCLLVDCGTMNYKSNRKSPPSFRDFVDKIIAKINHEPLGTYSAMITHFDKDHYLGFKHMDKKKLNGIFDCIYVPNLLVKDSITQRYFLLDQIVSSYLIYADGSPYYTFAEDALSHIIDLCHLAKKDKIRRLYYQQEFTIGDECFDVLWPDFIYPYSEILNKGNQTLEDVLSEADEVIKKSTDRKNVIEEIESIKNNFIEIFNEWYEICDNNETVSPRLLDEKKEALKENIKKLDKIRSNMNQEPIKRFRLRSKLGHFLIKSKNATSIVFHDRMHRILMTGDITSRIIDLVLYERFKYYYEAVKVPHHGTHSDNAEETRHYSYFLPMGCNYLISGGYCGKYNPVSDKYYDHFCIAARRWCTAGGNYCEVHGHKKNDCGHDNGRRCHRNSCHNQCVRLPL